MDVIFHCSDSKFGNAVIIDGWHREKGFDNGNGIHIGYHFVILNGQLSFNKYNRFFDGIIETGRPLDDDDKFEFDETAAATLGKNNCVQVCFIGESGKFTERQVYSGKNILQILKVTFGSIRVYQHADFDPVNRKYCAGFTADQMKIFNNPIKIFNNPI